jgi:hypothetical protein
MRGDADNNGYKVPSIGDRIEQIVGGVTIGGTVHYADHLQVLVKWDDGRSSSLRIGRDRFRVAAPSARPPSAPAPNGKTNIPSPPAIPKPSGHVRLGTAEVGYSQTSDDSES